MSLRLPICILSLTMTVNALSQEQSLTINGNVADIDTIFHATTGPGLTTTGIRINGRHNVFYTTIDLSNPDLELRAVQALDSELGSESVESMGTRKNKAGGKIYLAGVNGDFGNLSGSAKRTNGPAIIDRLMYCHGVGDKGWKAYSSFVAVEDAKDITITADCQLLTPLRFTDGSTYNMIFDSNRDEDCLVLYTPSYGPSTKTNVWGMECTLRLESGSIKGGDAVFSVTSDVIGDITNNPSYGNMAIPPDGFVLSGVGRATRCISSLRQGDRLRMLKPQVKVDGLPADVSSLIGGCPMIVVDGSPIDSERAIALNKSTAIQITPTARTAIGYDRDRTKLIMLVADSHSSNEHISGDHAAYGASSTGLDFPMLAQVMIYLGCHTATAMDGGGSSQLYNHMLDTRNLPYGKTSYLRPVSNGFFAVSTIGASDSGIAMIEAVQKKVALSTGEIFTPKIYGYNKAGILVDTDVRGFTLTIASELGSTDGPDFKAGSTAGCTHAIVTHGSARCAIELKVNGGDNFVKSGDNAPLMVTPPYKEDDSAAVPESVIENDIEAPLYYDLTGRLTAKPQRGIYIKRSGNRITKEYIRQ